MNAYCSIFLGLSFFSVLNNVLFLKSGVFKFSLTKGFSSIDLNIDLVLVYSLKDGFRTCFREKDFLPLELYTIFLTDFSLEAFIVCIKN